MLNKDWLRNTCEPVAAQKNIWVAYSGGVDSHVLLSLAAQAFTNVRAVHVHHGLSPNADQWQRHCEQICSNLKITLHTIHVNARPKAKQSPEDAARKARRKAWEDLLTCDDVLLVAHHAEDQAETILYRLFRGTGPKGLRGMLAHTHIGAAGLLRPLLNISKKNILNYAQTNNLIWISDESNLDTNYDRNFLRQQVMPLVTKRWPAAVSNINRAGELSGQLVDFTQPVIIEKLKAVYGNDFREINIEKLQENSELLRTEILRAWLAQHNITPELKQLRIIQQQVINAKLDANPQFVLGENIIRRSNNKLYLLANNQQPLTFKQVWEPNTDLVLPTGQRLLAEYRAKLGDNVVVKLGMYGDKVKKIFQKYSVPPWERSRYPLVFADDKLVAIIGLSSIRANAAAI